MAKKKELEKEKKAVKEAVLDFNELGSYIERNQAVILIFLTFLLAAAVSGDLTTFENPSTTNGVALSFLMLAMLSGASLLMDFLANTRSVKVPLGLFILFTLYLLLLILNELIAATETVYSVLFVVILFIPLSILVHSYYRFAHHVETRNLWMTRYHLGAIFIVSILLVSLVIMRLTSAQGWGELVNTAIEIVGILLLIALVSLLWKVPQIQRLFHH